MNVHDFESYLRFELNRSAHTVEAYMRDLHQFGEFLTPGTPELPDPELVTTADIRQWVASLSRNGRTATTVRRKVESLRAWFRFMRKRGVLESNPSTLVTLPKIPKTLPDTLRETEMERLLDQLSQAVPDPTGEDNGEEVKRMRTHLMMEMFYGLGIRRAELTAVTDPDIDTAGGEIKVHGKRSKDRIVPVPAQLLADIAAWQRLRDSLWPELKAPKPLFVSKGRPMTAAQVYNAVRNCLSDTSARHPGPHTLRHTFATSMLNGGADLNSVKEFLGHASLATTQIYTHVSFAEMKKAYRSAHPRAKDER